MTKRKIKKNITELDIPKELIKKEKPIESSSINGTKPISKWLKKQFKATVEIIKMTDRGLIEVEMVDSKGNFIIWHGQHFNTNKIKLNNKLDIVGKPKYFIEIKGVKKTVIEYMTY